ncbi:MAG: hypothetical protein ACI38Z_04595 [Parafannyhessea sp.]
MGQTIEEVEDAAYGCVLAEAERWENQADEEEEEDGDDDDDDER